MRRATIYGTYEPRYKDALHLAGSVAENVLAVAHKLRTSTQPQRIDAGLVWVEIATFHVSPLTTSAAAAAAAAAIGVIASRRHR